MKYISFIILTILITSCWTNTTKEISSTATQKTTNEINTEIKTLEINENTSIEENNTWESLMENNDEELLNSSESLERDSSERSEKNSSVMWTRDSEERQTRDSVESEDKVVKINTKYNHSGQEVDMNISYSLDENNLINSLEVSATNWDLAIFNEWAQIFIWKTVSEISETTDIISWQSLTTDAFKKALKNK